MAPDSITSQSHLEATCVDCSDTRKFHLADGDSNEAKAVYECGGCGHTIVLDLAP